LETAQKKANVAVKETEKQKGEAEARFEKARLASEDAIQRAQGIAVELEAAVKALAEAQRTAERAAKELEKFVGH